MTTANRIVVHIMKRLFQDVNFFSVKDCDFCYHGPVGLPGGRPRLGTARLERRSPAGDTAARTADPPPIIVAREIYMAKLAIGVVLEIWFVLAIVGGAFFRPPLSTVFVLALSVILLIPGVSLIVLGARRIALFKKVGSVAVATARQTGRVSVDDIARETGTDPVNVRLVVEALVKKGIMPRDCEVA
jgi:hypothetical protein